MRIDSEAVSREQTEMKRGAIFRDITKERQRQERLKAEGKFKYTCADAEMNAFDFLAVLGEEFGEVARAINERDPVNMRDEIIQVAACCVAWLEGHRL